MVRAGSADYGDYWGKVTDPDGHERDRDTQAERHYFLVDNAEMIAAINRRSPTTVLDFGSGLGWLLSAIECKYKAAVEIAPQAIERLRMDGVAVFGDLASVSSGAYDVVIAHHVIEHLVDPLYAMNHLRRVLAKDGMLVLGTPDFGSPCAKRFGANYRMLHDETHISLFTLESCSRMLRDMAFTIDAIDFPFPERHATPETFARWNDTSKVSPPWPGNWMTFYCTR